MTYAEIDENSSSTPEYIHATTSQIALALSNGNLIYDLVGGVAEWTDMTVTPAGMPVITNSHESDTNSHEWAEYYDVMDYKGFNIAPPYYYTGDNGIGRIKTGSYEGSAIRAFVRGATALFDLDTSYSPAEVSEAIGFRCAK
jgi:hypothetical protein